MKILKLANNQDEDLKVSPKTNKNKNWNARWAKFMVGKKRQKLILKKFSELFPQKNAKSEVPPAKSWGLDGA